MKAFEYIKSKMTDKPVEVIINGQPFYRVENGYTPVHGEFLIQSNDQFEKGKEAEIGEIRVKNSIKWKKVSEEKWAIASKSEEKKPDQVE